MSEKDTLSLRGKLYEGGKQILDALRRNRSKIVSAGARSAMAGSLIASGLPQEPILGEQPASNNNDGELPYVFNMSENPAETIGSDTFTFDSSPYGQNSSVGEPVIEQTSGGETCSLINNLEVGATDVQILVDQGDNIRTGPSTSDPIENSDGGVFWGRPAETAGWYVLYANGTNCTPLARPLYVFGQVVTIQGYVLDIVSMEHPEWFVGNATPTPTPSGGINTGESTGGEGDHEEEHQTREANIVMGVPEAFRQEIINQITAYNPNWRTIPEYSAEQLSASGMTVGDEQVPFGQIRTGDFAPTEYDVEGRVVRFVSYIGVFGGSLRIQGLETSSGVEIAPLLFYWIYDPQSGNVFVFHNNYNTDTDPVMQIYQIPGGDLSEAQTAENRLTYAQESEIISSISPGRVVLYRLSNNYRDDGTHYDLVWAALANGEHIPQEAIDPMENDALGYIPNEDQVAVEPTPTGD